MAETSQQDYPQLNPHQNMNGGSDELSQGLNPDQNQTGQTGGYSLQDTKNTVYNNAQSAMDNVRNSQTVQNINNGPVADKARAESNQVRGEFSNLANARQVPDAQTATGQHLTHYHSLFYTLLSWENPRATAISYAGIVLTIFAFRYLPIARYGLRLTWIVLGITAAAEIAGKMVFDQGFASKLRPKKYYTISRDTLDSVLGDVEQLINFFVIEFQRILFAENVYATVGAFFTALVTYFLIKVTPAWGLTLLGATAVYFVPLVYLSNKEFIDGHLNNAGSIINQQTQQARDIAAQQFGKAQQVTGQTFNQYSAKAKEAMGQAKGKAVQQGVVSGETADKTEESLRNAPSAPSNGPDSFQAETGQAEPIAQ